MTLLSMARGAGRLCSFFLVLSTALAASFPANESFEYSVQWRLIEAGKARISSSPHSIGVRVESTGLVSRLYKVEDDYRSELNSSLCTSETALTASEGKRRRQTRVTFDPQRRRGSYLEQDLVNNSTVLQKEIDTPVCVYDTVGALFELRRRNIALGHFVDMPLSDGKKFVIAKVEAQEREEVKTPAGTFKAIRYEAFLFNNVLYSRQARVFVWLTDDDRRLPVQIRIRLNIAVGTFNLQLTKEEHK